MRKHYFLLLLIACGSHKTVPRFAAEPVPEPVAPAMSNKPSDALKDDYPDFAEKLLGSGLDGVTSAPPGAEGASGASGDFGVSYIPWSVPFTVIPLAPAEADAITAAHVWWGNFDLNQVWDYNGMKIDLVKIENGYLVNGYFKITKKPKPGEPNIWAADGYNWPEALAAKATLADIVATNLTLSPLADYAVKANYDLLAMHDDTLLYSPTTQGASVADATTKISVQGKYTVYNGVSIAIGKTIKAKNGTLSPTDSVPSIDTQGVSAVGLSTLHPFLNGATTAYTSAGVLTSAVPARQVATITIFMPNNAALENNTAWNALLADPTGALRQNVLQHRGTMALSYDRLHTLAERGGTLATQHRTFTGAPSELALSLDAAGNIVINGSVKIISNEIPTADGSVYIVDGVLSTQ